MYIIFCKSQENLTQLVQLCILSRPLTCDTEGEILPTGHVYHVLQTLHLSGGFVSRGVTMTQLSNNFCTTLYILDSKKRSCLNSLNTLLKNLKSVKPKVKRKLKVKKLCYTDNLKILECFFKLMTKF